MTSLLLATSIVNPVAYAIAIISLAVFFAIAFVVSSVVELISSRIKRNRAIAYRLANQCKGITKKGEQCLRWNDCPSHKQANA